ncbi:MAG TPA: CvpA family protein [Rhizomicrobium sp.]|nr:CvpA family protein [Rhizomicrobium sp.]
MNLDFTFVDILVIIAVILSAVYAAIRGFVNETLSVFAWAAAAFATLYFAPLIAPYARAHMSTPLVGNLVAYAGIFLAVLVPLSFVSYRFSENVKNSPVGPADRALGVIFGVVRGLALTGIAYIFFSMFVPLNAQPHWIRGARLYPVIRGSSDMLLTLVPNQNLGPEAEVRRAERAVPPEHMAKKSVSRKHGHKTYGADDRRALDNLIETTGNSGGKQ